MLPSFNNVVVATKAWNRLLAVADWAQSREKQAEPKEPEPTMGEVLEQMAETERLKMRDLSPCTSLKTSKSYASIFRHL